MSRRSAAGSAASRAAAASHRSIVARAPMMRAAAAAPRSPASPAASASRAASAARSAMPAQHAAVRMASRENQGSRVISPGRAEDRQHRRALEDHAVALGRPHPGAREPGAVDPHPARHIDQRQHRRHGVAAHRHQGVPDPAGSGAEDLHALHAPVRSRPHQARGRSLARRRVGPPDAQPQLARGHGAELAVAQGRGGEGRDAFHRVEVAVHDASHRAVGPRHAAHQVPFRGRRRDATVRAARWRPAPRRAPGRAAPPRGSPPPPGRGPWRRPPPRPGPRPDRPRRAGRRRRRASRDGRGSGRPATTPPRARTAAQSGAIRRTVSRQSRRRAPGPIPSCISTVPPAASPGSTAASIVAASSPRQSWVSAVQPSMRNPRSAATAADHGAVSPQGVRHRRGRTPSASRAARARSVSRLDPPARGETVAHVVPAVEAHLVPVGEHRVDQVRVGPRARGDDEEDGPRPAARELREDPRGPHRVGAVVERQRGRRGPVRRRRLRAPHAHLCVAVGRDAVPLRRGWPNMLSR